VPISVVGKPALSWDGTNWVVVWRDTRRLTTAAHVYFTPWDGSSVARFPRERMSDMTALRFALSKMSAIARCYVRRRAAHARRIPRCVVIRPRRTAS
jgi:hypothetical protein